jgi:hypothetical protein
MMGRMSEDSIDISTRTGMPRAAKERISERNSKGGISVADISADDWQEGGASGLPLSAMPVVRKAKADGAAEQLRLRGRDLSILWVHGAGKGIQFRKGVVAHNDPWGVLAASARTNHGRHIPLAIRCCV